MSYPLNATIGVCAYQAGVEDSHGNPVDAWADPVPTRVYGYGPRSAGGAAEPNLPNRDLVIIGLTVYAPPGVQIDPRDRVQVDGVMYEVDGEIGDWNHGPFGFEPGISISLKRWEG